MDSSSQPTYGAVCMLVRFVPLVVLLAQPLTACGQAVGHAPTRRSATPATPRPLLFWENDAAVISRGLPRPAGDLYFRLQREGQTVARVPANGSSRFTPDMKQPGRYTIVLERFLPAHSTGPRQPSGSFHPVSNVLELTVAQPPLARHVDAVQPAPPTQNAERGRDAGELAKARADLDGDHADCERCPARSAAESDRVRSSRGAACKLDGSQPRTRPEAWAEKVKSDRAQIVRHAEEKTRDATPSPAPPPATVPASGSEPAVGPVKP